MSIAQCYNDKLNYLLDIKFMEMKKNKIKMMHCKILIVYIVPEQPRFILIFMSIAQCYNDKLNYLLHMKLMEIKKIKIKIIYCKISIVYIVLL